MKSKRTPTTLLASAAPLVLNSETFASFAPPGWAATVSALTNACRRRIERERDFIVLLETALIAPTGEGVDFRDRVAAAISSVLGWKMQRFVQSCYLLRYGGRHPTDLLEQSQSIDLEPSPGDLPVADLIDDVARLCHPRVTFL